MVIFASASTASAATAAARRLPILPPALGSGRVSGSGRGGGFAGIRTFRTLRIISNRHNSNNRRTLRLRWPATTATTTTTTTSHRHDDCIRRPFPPSFSAPFGTTGVDSTGVDSTDGDSSAAANDAITPATLASPAIPNNSSSNNNNNNNNNNVEAIEFAARTKPRVLILGSGWAGFTLARRLDKSLFDVRVVSPSNHFLFTPLLPSTAVGTLEFRAIQEPVRTIEGLGQYYQAKARTIDTEGGVVTCEDLHKDGRPELTYDVPYDYLCVAGGMKSNTFNTHNVQRLEGVVVFFLKHLYHARQIRDRILECFERASNHTVKEIQRDRLLSFIVVGGGPTSCEFMSELHDFITSDVARWYPDLVPHIKLTLAEAGPGILGSFDKALSEYYLEKLREKDIDVRLNTAVAGIDERLIENEHITVARFADGSEVNFGAMVWSAGLAPVKLVQHSDLGLDRGRIAVDDYLRVPDARGRVYALGDCAASPDSLPPTATVAEQQALYLADCFNNYYSKFDVLDGKGKDVDVPLPGNVTPYLMPWNFATAMNKVLTKSAPEFQYKNRGAMASMGFGGGVTDLKQTSLPSPKTTLTGTASYVAWSGTYLTKQLSIQNMVLIPMYWFKAFVFGRDISRF